MNGYPVGTLLAATMLVTDAACAQSFPNKPIRVITSSEGGGGGDVIIRVIQPSVVAALGQPLVVENRQLAVAAVSLAKGPADGYTVAVYGTALWLSPLMQPSGYDAVRDFAGVSMLTRQPGVILAHSSLPINSIKELVAMAKAKPGVLNYGSSTAGGISHLGFELFKSMAGVDIVRIPHSGIASATTSLLANEVQLMLATSTAASAAIKTNRVKALAVTTAQRSALLPDLPTVAESGVPGYQAASVYGMVTAAKTPAAVVKLLNEKVVAALNNSEAKEKFFGAGTEVVGSSPQELDAFIKAEVTRMGKVIKDAGITVK